MIIINKKYKGIYPAKQIYFADNPTYVKAIAPWGIYWLSQATSHIKDECNRLVLAAKPFHTLFSDLSLPTDDLKARIDKDTLYEIRRAEALNIEVIVNKLPFEKLMPILRSFHEIKNLPSPAEDYIKTVLPFSDVVTASLDGQIAIIHILMVDAPSRTRLLYSFHDVDADISNKNRGYTNKYLHWWELQHYKDTGLNAYDWGGVILNPESPAYGISKFKRSFGGEQRDEWHMLVGGRLVRSVWNTGLGSKLTPKEFSTEVL